MKKSKGFTVAVFLCFVLITGLIMSQAAQGAEAINIATAGIGGTYYPVGSAIAKIISKYVEGATGTAEVTGAAVENVRLLGRKKVRLAFVEPTFAGIRAYQGRDPFDEKIDIRMVARLHWTLFTPVVLKKSGIKKITDLKGKRCSVGRKGSSTVKITANVLKAYGLSFDDIDVRYLGHSEAADGLRDGSLDMAVIVGAPPAAAVMSIATTHAIDIVSIDEEKIEQLKAMDPSVPVYKLPKGTYRRVDRDCLVPLGGTTLMCRPEEKDELIYNILKAIDDHRDILWDSHPAAKVITLEGQTTDVGIPFHPGAIKFYKDKGVWKR